MSNNEIVSAKQKMASLRALLTSEKVAGQIMSALPRHLDGARLLRVYLTAVQTTPRILDCDAVSVVGAVIQAAQVGLSLDNVFGEGYLIPRWNKNTSSHVCTFQAGYKGLRKLALQADKGLRDIYARVVFENDSFDFSYEPAMLRHTPHPDPAYRGNLKFAYAKAIWKEDNYDRFVVVGAPEIAKARAASESAKKGYGPWVEHEEAMWAKTGLRRLCDTLALSADSDLARVMAAEDTDGKSALAGLDFDISQAAGPAAAPSGSALDQLAGGQMQQERQRQPRRPRQAQQAPVETEGSEAPAPGGPANDQGGPVQP